MNGGIVQLLAFNQAGTAPGVPKNYPAAKKLVTEDCISCFCLAGELKPTLKPNP